MSLGRIFGIGLAAIIGLGAITIIGGSWYTIDQGERGVLLRNGAVIGSAEPGLGFKFPIIDSVVRVSTREQAIKWICFDNECINKGDWPVMQAYSKDQQAADIRVSVNFSVPPDQVTELYTDYDTIGNLISRSVSRKAQQAVKQTFGKYNAATAVVERQRLAQESLEALKGMMINEPIVITALQIENIDYSEVYERAIEERMLAEVEVAKRNQQLATEEINARIAVTQAQGRADSVKAEADANAYKVKIEGEAEAAAIAARGAALADSPALVDLTAVEKWDGVLPTSIPPNGSVPFLGVR